VPLNLLGDFGGGAMLLAVGVLAALLHARVPGQGQVVDAAIVDGVSLLSALPHGLRGQGRWLDTRGGNVLDGGAPFYGVYACRDGRYVSVGAIEDRFYTELLDRLGVPGDDPLRTGRRDRERWPLLRSRFEALFATRTQAEWVELLEGTDACFAPVVPYAEAAQHRQLLARRTVVSAFGTDQPAPAPRFDRTPARLSAPPPAPGEHTGAILAELGYSPTEIAQLLQAGAVHPRRAR
jgi:alpha-methylacyl-CoA racemase